MTLSESGMPMSESGMPWGGGSEGDFFVHLDIFGHGIPLSDNLTQSCPEPRFSIFFHVCDANQSCDGGSS